MLLIHSFTSNIRVYLLVSQYNKDVNKIKFIIYILFSYGNREFLRIIFISIV